MVRENARSVMKTLLKRLGQGSNDSGALVRLMDEYLPAGASPETAEEELLQCLCALRDLHRQKALPPGVSLGAITAAMGELAHRRNFPVESFYAAILERMITAAGEAEEGLRPQIKLSTQERILNAALDVFSEKGFHSATVDEIAERAGLGKGTLYRYFSNKETLFKELVRLRLDELERSATDILDGQDDVLTMITKYLRVYFEFFDRNARLYRLIVQERMDVGDQMQDLYLKKVMRRVPHLKLKIYGASQQGVLKDVDFHTVFYGVMGFVHGVIQKWLDRDCAYPLVEELPGVVEVLFYGFVNTPRNGVGQP